MKYIEDWDNYVQNDPIRNNLVIPDLTESIEFLKAKSILDLGSGSGYISKEIFNKLKGKIDLHLLDVDIKFIQYSKVKYFQNVDEINFIVSDIKEYEESKKFDVIFCSFSNLEFLFDHFLVIKLKKMLNKNGRFILYMPDCLEDILQNSNSGNNFKEYINGSTTFSNKEITKKMGRPYLTNRIEFLLEMFTENGFVLEIFKFLEYNGKKIIKISIL